ncbi:MAG TPA: hypothetical protein VF781_15500 [Solirubrobacteraceae bacterium]
MRRLAFMAGMLLAFGLAGRASAADPALVFDGVRDVAASSNVGTCPVQVDLAFSITPGTLTPGSGLDFYRPSLTGHVAVDGVALTQDQIATAIAASSYTLALLLRDTSAGTHALTLTGGPSGIEMVNYASPTQYVYMAADATANFTVAQCVPVATPSPAPALPSAMPAPASPPPPTAAVTVKATTAPVGAAQPAVAPSAAPTTATPSPSPSPTPSPSASDTPAPLAAAPVVAAGTTGDGGLGLVAFVVGALAVSGLGAAIAAGRRRP